MKLSVIVPVYNVEKYIKRCLDSIESQYFSDYEIIIVDDGSKESSAKYCDKILFKNRNVITIHKKNEGLSSARNIGIEIANGEYICFVDSDDSIEPKMFECLVNKMNNTQSLIACFGHYDVYGDSKKMGPNPKKEEIISNSEAISRMLTSDGLDVSACTKMYSSKLFKKIKFPVGTNCEDIYIMSELLYNSKSILLLPDIFYNYNHRNDSISTKRFNKNSFDYVISTKYSMEYIIKNDKDNEYLARAAFFDSICITGNNYLSLDSKNQNMYLYEFQKHIVDNIVDSYKWYQSVDCNNINESFVYCVKKYLNMYAVILSNGKSKKILKNIKKEYLKEFKRLRKIVNISIIDTPFLYYVAYPFYTCGYRLIRKFITIVFKRKEKD